MKITKYDEPYPYLVIDDVLSDEFISKMRFPDLERRSNTRSGWDLFKGEREWGEFFGKEPWKEVAEKLDSLEFVQTILSFFERELAEIGIEHKAIRVIDYIETPADQQCKQLDWKRKFDGNVFTRMDLQASNGSTLRIPHVDHARRVTGGVLFLCDAEEEGIDGGEFGVWIDDEFSNDRVPHKCRLYKTLPIKKNRMYIFLNRNDAFHAPSPIVSCEGMRKWIYYSISSKQNVWRYDGEPSRFGGYARDLARKFRYAYANRS